MTSVETKTDAKDAAAQKEHLCVIRDDFAAIVQLAKTLENGDSCKKCKAKIKHLTKNAWNVICLPSKR